MTRIPLLACGLAAGMAFGCSSGPRGDAPQPAATSALAPAAAAHESLPAGPVPAAADPDQPSIYELRMQLTDQSNRAITLDVHRGQPTIISMFYASCPNACPLLIQDIKRIEAELDEASRADTRVLLVSLTPEADTPEAMTELAERQGVDLSRWTLARTPAESVRELAAVLGVRYRALPDGNVNHSSLITALDRDGRVLARIDGLQQPPEPVVDALRAAAAAR